MNLISRWRLMKFIAGAYSQKKKNFCGSMPILYILRISAFVLRLMALCSFTEAVGILSNFSKRQEPVFSYGHSWLTVKKPIVKESYLRENVNRVTKAGSTEILQ
jgi:hypothetical protein